MASGVRNAGRTLDLRMKGFFLFMIMRSFACHVRKNKRHGTITRRSRKKSSVNVWPSNSWPWWTPEDTAFTTSIPTSADQQKKAIFGALQPYPPPIRFALRVSLVSIQKWPFSPIFSLRQRLRLDKLCRSAGFLVRRTTCTSPRNPLTSLTLRKIAYF